MSWTAAWITDTATGERVAPLPLTALTLAWVRGSSVEQVSATLTPSDVSALFPDVAGMYAATRPGERSLVVERDGVARACAISRRTYRMPAGTLTVSGTLSATGSGN